MSRCSSFYEEPFMHRLTIVRKNSLDMKYIQIKEIPQQGQKAASPPRTEEKNAILYFKNYVINGKYGLIQQEEVKFINQNYFD